MNRNRLEKTREYLIAGSAVAALVVTVVFGIAGQISPWFIQLVSTLIAAALAGALGLHLYYKQLVDRQKHFHELVISYMDYLIASTPVEAKVDHVIMTYVNRDLLNQAILEENDRSVAIELIKLQGHIETYATLTTNSLLRNNDRGKGPTSVSQAVYILTSARVMVRQAQLCKGLLLGAVPQEPKIGLPNETEILRVVQEKEASNQKAGLDWLFRRLSTAESNFTKLDLDEIAGIMVANDLLKEWHGGILEKSYSLHPRGKQLLAKTNESLQTEEGAV